MYYLLGWIFAYITHIHSIENPFNPCVCFSLNAWRTLTLMIGVSVTCAGWTTTSHVSWTSSDAKTKTMTAKWHDKSSLMASWLQVSHMTNKLWRHHHAFVTWLPSIFKRLWFLIIPQSHGPTFVQIFLPFYLKVPASIHVNQGWHIVWNQYINQYWMQHTLYICSPSSSDISIYIRYWYANPATNLYISPMIPLSSLFHLLDSNNPLRFTAYCTLLQSLRLLWFVDLSTILYCDLLRNCKPVFLLNEVEFSRLSHYIWLFHVDYIVSIIQFRSRCQLEAEG